MKPVSPVAMPVELIQTRSAKGVAAAIRYIVQGRVEDGERGEWIG